MDCESSWCTQDNHIRQRFIAHCAFLGTLAGISGYTAYSQLAYHPQTDGQTERINQILEDMLRAYVLSYSKKWDECLPLAEFSYNNSYQESIRMAPFEALYGRRCRTPVNWSEAGERNVFGSDMVSEAKEQVRFIQENLKIDQSRQKSYADKKR